jgi:hypothetical protein
MNITQEFIDNLKFTGGWRLETIGTKTFHVINDAVYCRAFWVAYWSQIGYENFARQSFIRQIKDGDLTRKVILDTATGDLILSMNTWTLVNYLGTFDTGNKPPLSHNIAFSPIYTILIYVMVCLVILFVTPRRMKYVGTLN